MPLPASLAQSAPSVKRWLLLPGRVLGGLRLLRPPHVGVHQHLVWRLLASEHGDHVLADVDPLRVHVVDAVLKDEGRRSLCTG